MAHGNRCATEMLISVAHLVLCATETLVSSNTSVPALVFDHTENEELLMDFGKLKQRGAGLIHFWKLKQILMKNPLNSLLLAI